MPTQADTIPAQANTSPNVPAHFCATEESPSSTRNPLCERHLYRWLRTSFPFWGTRQFGLGGCRQGIDAIRLVQRRELTEKNNAL
jgi:hypothetical protein